LVVDGGGSPTEIVKGADNILDMYYELRNHITVTDWNGVIDITGVSYDVILRAARASTTTNWLAGESREGLGSVTGVTGYTGNIGADIFTDPTGSLGDLLSKGSTSIIGSGTYFNDVQIEASLDAWNANLRSVRFQTGNCNWQVQYNATVGGAAIPKTNEKRLRLKYRLSWVRL
jgi:hypothetical protein